MRNYDFTLLPLFVGREGYHLVQGPLVLSMPHITKIRKSHYNLTQKYKTLQNLHANNETIFPRTGLQTGQEFLCEKTAYKDAIYCLRFVYNPHRMS
jgi:hypothetical protein